MNSVAPILQTDREVELVKRVAAADLTPSEFDHFTHMARTWRLDPLRKQLYAVVYNKNKPNKRRVSYITGIDGYRAIADRTGCYRPGFRSVVRDNEARDDATNPKGIVSANATVWKFAQGEWHEFSEEVEWDEFAPIKTVWENNQPTDRVELDRSGLWPKMGVNQLKKCAEAQALRRGWPDEFSGLYVDAEFDQVQAGEMIDITPTEQTARAEQERLQAKLGGPGLTVDWCDGEPLQTIPLGKFHDAVQQFIRAHSEDFPERIALFSQRNTHAMREFYTHDKDAALSIKKGLETYERVAANV